MASRPPKLLIVSYYYPPAGGIGLPGCMRVVKFVKYLQGWDVRVLTVRPERYPEFFRMDNRLPLPIKEEKIVRTSITDPFQGILRLRAVAKGAWRSKEPAPPDPGSARGPEMSDAEARGGRERGAFGRLKDFVHDACYFPDFASPWIPDAVLSGVGTARKEKPDIIFATGMPWSALIVANLLHRLTGIPYVCDFRDPWIGNPFHQSKGRVFDRMHRHFEQSVVRRSALVTANTAPLRHRIASRYADVPEDRIMVLPNGYDPEDFPAVSSPEGTAEAAEGLTLVHAGFLYGERDPAPILEAIRQNRERYGHPGDPARFTQIGSVEKSIEERMRSHVEEGNAACLGQLPYRDCIEKLRAADVLVIIQQSTDTQIPSKIYEYVSLGKPILTITKSGGALWNLVRQYGFGDLFEPDETAKIGEKIHEYGMRKKREGTLKETYPRRTEFDVRNIAGRLSDAMRELCRVR
jgi:glycosyltransferase involved in cell wall biosynthesis